MEPPRLVGRSGAVAPRLGPDPLALDFQRLFESTPGCYLVLDPDFTIVAVNAAYLAATNTVREKIVGRGIFDVFPDNPDDVGATGVSNLRASLTRARAEGVADTMGVQKYDIRTSDSDDSEFEVRYWSPINTPVLSSDGSVAFIIHRVEDVSEFVVLKGLEREHSRVAVELRRQTVRMEADIIQRSRELQQANHKLRLILDAAQDAFISTDVHGRIRGWNAMAESLFGWSSEQVIGRTLTATILPSALLVAVTGEPVADRIVGVDDSDAPQYMSATSQPIWDEAGTRVGDVLVVRDVTARCRADAELRASERRLADAQTAGRIGSWEWDIPANKVVWSDQLYKLYGKDPATFSATYEGFVDGVHPEDRVIVETAVRRAFETGEQFEFVHRIVTPDGIRWLRGAGQVTTDAHGIAVRMSGTAQDITNTRRADQRFEALLEAAPDAIVVVDSDGIIRLVNRQTEVLFGYSRADLLGHALEILIPARLRLNHPDLRNDYVGDPRVRPMGAGMDLIACRRDGTEFPVDISLSPLETEAGTLVSAAIRDISARKEAEAAVAHQAAHDSLTDLPNRILLVDRLTQALVRSRRDDTTVSVSFIDLDGFKVVNDSRGHSVGDAVLKVMADRLRATVRACDTVARFGGDEFVVVAESVKSDQSPLNSAKRIAAALVQPVRLGDTDAVLTASIGVAVAGPLDDAESLLRDADAAMYEAKARGRDMCVMFDAGMRANATGRLDRERALRRAIDAAEISVFYQPIVDLTTGLVMGVEALARWTDPQKGLVLPGEFIPIAEEAGLIGALGASVLRQACCQVAAWKDRFPWAGPLSVAVNLSARQLLSPGLPETVAETLVLSGLDAACLCLEITESVLLDDADSAAKALRALKALGVRIAVDDFGTGYSSLTYLKRFPVDTLKIDKSFVAGIGDSTSGRGDRAIVASIIDLAHAFGLTTIAEGVETGDQMEHLRSLGCEQAQGYWLSRAVPPSAAAAWIARSVRSKPADPTITPSSLKKRAKRILLVDDDRSFRELLHNLLADHPGLDVVAEAEDGRQAVALARHFKPDLVILDLAMPGMGGLEALSLIRAVAPGAAVAIVSALDRSDLAEKAQTEGAGAYFTKGDDLTKMIAYVEQWRAPSVDLPDPLVPSGPINVA